MSGVVARGKPVEENRSPAVAAAGARPSIVVGWGRAQVAPEHLLEPVVRAQEVSAETGKGPHETVLGHAVGQESFDTGEMHGRHHQGSWCVGDVRTREVVEEARVVGELGGAQCQYEDIDPADVGPGEDGHVDALGVESSRTANTYPLPVEAFGRRPSPPARGGRHRPRRGADARRGRVR